MAVASKAKQWQLQDQVTAAARPSNDSSKTKPWKQQDQPAVLLEMTAPAAETQQQAAALATSR